MTDEVQRTDGEVLEYMGTDAAKWADEFMRIQRSRPGTMDWGAMVGWFANAIEAGRSAGARAVCPHTDTGELSKDLSYCRTCGKLLSPGGEPVDA